jgi:hypothetical protein
MTRVVRENTDNKQAMYYTWYMKTQLAFMTPEEHEHTNSKQARVDEVDCELDRGHLL